MALGHLAQLMFLQILRVRLESSEPLAAGWLRGLSDASVAPALRVMHGEPERSWHLDELARTAAMSRTTFAAHFKAVVGVPPLTYLLDWRMRLAERALREGNARLSSIASSVGYTSESAFSNAFKRIVGKSPKRYRDAMRSTNP